MPRGSHVISHVSKWDPLADVAATWHPHGAGVEIAKASLARGIPELTGDGDGDGDGESPNYEIEDGAGMG
ncbi:hypothetical protein Tco_0219059 [Tanacetum coccineum]